MLARPALAVAFFPHHVEHLAPVCGMLGVPMLACDSPGQRAALLSYPALSTDLIGGLRMPEGVERVVARIDELGPDVVLYSDLVARDALRRYFRGRRKVPRIVHVPHGFSEKRQPWARGIATQDVALMIGRHAIDQLASFGVERCEATLVVSGNLRRAWFDAHAAFFAGARRSWGLREDPRRTVLYAPTWDDAIGSSSFFGAVAALVAALPRDTRLVVKLHPHLERDAQAVTALLAPYAGRDDVVVLRGCPLVHPVLELADVYLGDMSAMAYDFLAWGRPMFFLNALEGTAHDPRGARLWGCGTAIAPSDFARSFDIVARGLEDDAARHAEARRALDAYTHAPPLDAPALAAAIDAATAGAPPAWMRGRG